ncbi:MAG: hypothetical protein WCI77_01840 [Candidatus Omnitrophota bacterium]
MNFIIPTLILWVTNALLVIPLANKWTARQLNIAADTDVKTLPEEKRKEIERAFVKKYILTDIIVLGLVGLVGGLLGYFFIGFSFEKRGWPGMLAFILASFLGFTAKGGTL